MLNKHNAKALGFLIGFVILCVVVTLSYGLTVLVTPLKYSFGVNVGLIFFWLVFNLSRYKHVATEMEEKLRGPISDLLMGIETDAHKEAEKAVRARQGSNIGMGGIPLNMGMGGMGIGMGSESDGGMGGMGMGSESDGGMGMGMGGNVMNTPSSSSQSQPVSRSRKSPSAVAVHTNTFCPHCGNQCDPTHKFCKRCGNQIT